MNKEFICEDCNKNYKNYHCLWNHKKKYHTEIKNDINIIDNNKIICEYCNKNFNTRQAKSMHKKKCNERNKFIEKEKEELKIMQLKKELTEIKLKTQLEKAKKEFTLSLIHNNIQQNSIQEPIENNIIEPIQSAGYIYLIHEREFMNAKEDIYKIGRSKDINQRIKGYPNDSRLCYTRWSKNIKLYEKELIDLFKINFINKKKIGTEYFEGDENKMIDVINEYYKLIKL